MRKGKRRNRGGSAVGQGQVIYSDEALFIISSVGGRRLTSRPREWVAKYEHVMRTHKRTTER